MENGLVIDHGPVSSGMSIGTSKPPDEQDTRPQYSMPGILHFLQTEWARFEMERSQWEVERAELQARIAFLQGERKGQENLKHDLVRRIKMLEFALKQERAKFHKLKYGSDVNQSELITEKKEEDEFLEPEPINTTNSNATWKQGRQLLRQYLREIGYTDTIIDVRSSRVRQLLGVQAHNAENESDRIIMNGEARRGSKKLGPSIGESALLDSESSVLATFDFLMSEQGGEDEKLAGDEDHENEDDEDNDRLVKRQRKDNTKSSGNESLADADAEDALAEFDFLESSDAGAGEARTDSTQWEKKDMSPSEEWDVDQQLISKLKEQYKKERKAGQKRLTLQSFIDNLGKDVDMADIDSTNATPATPANTGVVQQQAVQPNSVDMADTSNGLPKSNLGSDEDALDAALGLGDLAGLTVSNDEDLSYDISPSSKEACRKTWNAKYTLRSHFDGVRALAFHPVDPVLITASEDHTLKLWNLQKSVPTKKTTSLDVEPVYTFRGHCGAVLCVKMCPTGEVCYSAGLDAAIRCWNLPSTNIDPYDSYDPSVLGDTLIAHTDAVWGLAVHSISHNLLSCSADGTVRLWNPNNKTLLNTFRVEEEEGVPTSVDFVSCDSNQMLAAYSSSNAYLFDLETAKQIVHFDSNQEGDTEPGDQINTIISHPTLPITITGHENRHIRFFDNNTGKVIHSMVAHLDAVTSLAVDPNGLYLLSGSHDSSIRLWNLDSKTCVQEITSHRRKFDESIYDVAFHSSKPYLASAGADALAKVFV